MENVACPDVRDDMMIASDRITTTNHSRHDGHLSPLSEFFKAGFYKMASSTQGGHQNGKVHFIKMERLSELRSTAEGPVIDYKEGGTER